VARNYPLSYRFGNKSEFFGEIAGDVINPLSSEKIKSSKLKALVLVGDQDQVTPKEMATSLAQDYPGSTLKIIGGGHSSSIDFVAASKLIEEFI
jgi:pimeloyl-ACP methyl ester carboxylesterase